MTEYQARTINHLLTNFVGDRETVRDLQAIGCSTTGERATMRKSRAKLFAALAAAKVEHSPRIDDEDIERIMEAIA
jgi:hypothetical protein